MQYYHLPYVFLNFILRIILHIILRIFLHIRVDLQFRLYHLCLLPYAVLLWVQKYFYLSAHTKTPKFQNGFRRFVNFITPSFQFCRRQNFLYQRFNEAGNKLAACYLSQPPRAEVVGIFYRVIFESNAYLFSAAASEGLGVFEGAFFR